MDNEAYNKRLDLVAEIAQRETTHMQWLKQSITWFLIVFLIFMNLSMGSGDSASIIGTRVCGYYYWAI